MNSDQPPGPDTDPKDPKTASSTTPTTPAATRSGSRDRRRPRRANLVAAVLALLLGFAMVTQVRQTRTSGLESLSQSDLVAVLGNVNNQSTRLQREATELTQTRDRLRSGGTGVAEAAARERLTTLGILAGTVKATGPGVQITVTDAQGAVSAPNLLDAVQELRDAGAEAIQIGPVRVVASTWFGTDAQNNVVIDGTVVRPPYTILAIGDAATMATAMAIPGGIVETLEQLGARAVVTQRQQVTIGALRPLEAARYARPGAAG